MTKTNEFELDINELFHQEIRKAEKTLKEIESLYTKDLKSLEKLSDAIARIGGSWGFIFSFLLFIFIWIGINTFALFGVYDPFPFILLNLILSCLAAIQAPVILMAQNRASKRDQIRAELDLEKDLRDLHIDENSHRMLLKLQKDIKKIKKKLKVR
ncbi:MAG TPA: DUF1003 domain-containing protein [Candidatus Nanoarchaeia archaeon]|nr:DUF1003 domain-containing protein [Candidatus Nanoarchaeia archaeon]